MVNLTFSFSTGCHVDENQVTCHLKERPGGRARYYIIHRAGPGGGGGGGAYASHTQYLRLHVSIFNKLSQAILCLVVDPVKK